MYIYILIHTRVCVYFFIYIVIHPQPHMLIVHGTLNRINSEILHLQFKDVLKIPPPAPACI